MIKTLMRVGNITGNDLFNASTAESIKNAGRNKIEGLLSGCAIVQNVDDETGETSVSSVMKVNDTLYAGGSKVMTNRLQKLVEFMGEDVIKEGANIRFREIQTKSGTGVTFELI